MTLGPFIRRHRIPIVAGGCLLVVLGIYAGNYLYPKLAGFYHVFTDKAQVKAFVNSFGIAAPLVFVAIQVLQVIFAPIPGEISGFAGGYLFGAALGFIYSTIGLTLGSWINFFLGRLLGRHFVRRLIPPHTLERFDKIAKREGIIFIFIFFLLPGFPKDYLCLFLGITRIPFKVLLALSAVGRMPGTFMLSLQGALLFQGQYAGMALFSGMSLLFILVVYRYRENLYGWAEKLNQEK
ncbi:MAG: TVP38/TMEM64 family protein [Desulfobacterales bacterium]|nr:TVP38/TMEM64 family protein [Desulfobacterales bacterium]